MDKKYTIESTEKKFDLSNNIIGFSGINENNNIDRKEKLFKATLNGFDLLVFFKPADRSHHKAQDSVGLFVGEDTIKFGIADGVSIIQGTYENQSEVLAKNLIISLPNLNEAWEKEVEKISNNFIQGKKIGASNFFWGQISTISSSKLSLGYVSSSEDFGLNKIYQQGKLEDLRNESWGFLPNYYKTDHFILDLPDSFSAVFSSDGINIDNLNLKSFLKFLKENPNINDIKAYLISIIQQSSDDQSMIIIGRN